MIFHNYQLILIANSWLVLTTFKRTLKSMFPYQTLGLNSISTLASFIMTMKEWLYLRSYMENLDSRYGTTLTPLCKLTTCSLSKFKFMTQVSQFLALRFLNSKSTFLLYYASWGFTLILELNLKQNSHFRFIIALMITSLSNFNSTFTVQKKKWTMIFLRVNFIKDTCLAI